MKCQWEQAESIENYRVLGIFSKYYSKCFVYMESDKILQDKYYKKYNIIARMMQKDGVDFKEVYLDKYGHQDLRYMFCIKHRSEVFSVESNLKDYYFC